MAAVTALDETEVWVGSALLGETVVVSVIERLAYSGQQGIQAAGRLGGFKGCQLCHLRVEGSDG